MLINLDDSLEELNDVEKQFIKQELQISIGKIGWAGRSVCRLLHNVIDLCGWGNRGVVRKSIVGRTCGRESPSRVCDLEAGEGFGSGRRGGSDGDLKGGAMRIINKKEKGVKSVLEGRQSTGFEDVFYENKEKRPKAT